MRHKVEFLKSALEPRDFPQHILPEIAMTGRSNSGKSSLINALAGQKLARVSQIPGKTRLLNFFEFDKKYCLVDMPGYGYAARGRSEIESWQGFVEAYFSVRGQLKGFFLLMDIRREWAEEEQMIKNLSEQLEKPMALILTKADKVSRGQWTPLIKEFEKASGTSFIFPVSATHNMGIKELEDFYFKNWVAQGSPL